MVDSHPLQNGDPDTLGGYRLLGRLGAGGQGVVYLGEAADGARVAVKTLVGEALNDPERRQRFVREAEAARQVASFCTAALLRADFDATPAYTVSEYVEGPSLQRAVADRGPLAGGELNRAAVATATALMAIHEAGLVHRDFKPGNVLLGPDGARVIDFGLARMEQDATTLTASSVAVGTPSYMAPEQISGDPVGPATDVFAWGAVMIFAATGRRPFPGDSVPALLHQVLNGAPDTTGVPDELRGLVATAMDKDPARRPSPIDLLMTLIGRRERPADRPATTQMMREAADSVSPAPAHPDTTQPAGPSAPSTASLSQPVPPPGQPTGPHVGSAAPHPAPPTQADASSQATHHPPGSGAAPTRRGRAKAWVFGSVAAALGVVLLAGGITLGASLGTSGSPDGGSSDSSKLQSPQAAAGRDRSSDRDDASDDGDNPLNSNDPEAFTGEYWGEWSGMLEDTSYTLSVRKDEAKLVNEANDECFYVLKPTKRIEKAMEEGYKGARQTDVDDSSACGAEADKGAVMAKDATLYLAIAPKGADENSDKVEKATMYRE